MFKHITLCAALLVPLSAHATTDQELDEIRAQIKKLQQADVTAQQNGRPAATGAAAFNPAISLILSGTYGQLRQDPAIPATGFAMSAHPEHSQGFNLGESELVMSANIDPEFRGEITLALEPDDSLGVENAFVQTSGLGHGLNFKMGQTHTHRYMQMLLERIEDGQIDPSFVISHRISLDEAPQGYKTFRDKQDSCTKVVMHLT